MQNQSLISNLYIHTFMRKNLLRLSEQVRHAIGSNKPVVALQSTIISHGMPYPQNLACALSIQKTVRQNGAIPATIAVIDGYLQVGLQQKMIEKLAFEGMKVKKISRRDFPYIISSQKIGATTVSATMIGAKMAGIDIFVTGGIGGVHRGYEETMDVSADLRQLGRTRVTVVSAGVKSILDISKTLQFLQTEGVPVITYGSQYFPAFFSASSGIKSPYFFNKIEEIASLILSQQMLKLQNGLLVAVPNPNPAEGQATEKAINQALKESKDAGVKGAQITPFLLKRVAQLTQGKSLKSNISLVHNNAKVGSQLAVSLADLKNKQKNSHSFHAFHVKSGQETSSQPKIIVIGGSAIDYQIKSIPGLKFQLYKSCIGKSRKTLGGVGRNIAECAAKLGVKTHLITGLSADSDGQSILKNCQKHNIQVFSSNRSSLFSTGKYLAIMDEQNNQLIGISDMQINETLNFKNTYENYLKSHKISERDIVVVDANFQKDSLKELLMYLNQRKCFIIFEAKGQKSKKIIQTEGHYFISLLKMNEIEGKQILSGDKAQKLFIAQIGQKSLGNNYRGYKTIITNGGCQLTVAKNDNSMQRIEVPAAQRIVKTTGAGDTLTGTLAAMLIRSIPPQKALQIALKASKKAVQSDIEQSVIPQLKFSQLLN